MLASPPKAAAHAPLPAAVLGSPDHLRPAALARRLWRGLAGRVRRVFLRLAAAARLRRQRRDLSRLDDRLLSDIGLCRARAETEAARSIWNPPLHWRG